MKVQTNHPSKFPLFAQRCWYLVNQDPLKDFVKELHDKDIYEEELCEELKKVRPVLPEPFQIEVQNKYRDMMYLNGGYCMSNIPEVKIQSTENVRLSYDREGKKYIESVIDEMNKKQPMIIYETLKLLDHLDKKLRHDNVNQTEEEKERVDRLADYVIENVGYMVVSILKSLYIQEEANELAQQYDDIEEASNEEE